MIKLATILNKGLPITEDPYGSLAELLNTSKEEILKEIKKLMAENKIIKFRAELDYEKLGYKVSALIAMQISINIERAIDDICKVKNVTHFYERESPESFPYNFYAMTHFKNESDLNAFLDKLNNLEINYKVLKTLKKYKRGGTKI
ncbi:MAG: Lrp/AsnC family transcriptional regulator [Thermoplasmata archaeon]